MNNAISWFEIPATELDRAQKFYETIFGISMIPMDMENIKMRMFPLDDMMKEVGGAVVDSGGFHKPSATDGPLVYLNGNPDVQNIINKVEAAGGSIMVPKTQISPEYGYMAVIRAAVVAPTEQSAGSGGRIRDAGRSRTHAGAGPGSSSSNSRATAKRCGPACADC